MLFRKKQTQHPFLTAQPQADRASNVIVIGLGVVFVATTAALLMLRPAPNSNGDLQFVSAPAAQAPAPTQPAAPMQTYAAAQPQTAPQPAVSLRPVARTAQQQPEPNQVSRSATPILNIAHVSNTPQADSAYTTHAINSALRQPIRLTSNRVRVIDLPALTSVVLTAFAGQRPYDEQIKTMTMQTVTEKQSNAYVGALLNTAIDRSNLEIPAALRTPSQDLDANALLNGMLEAAGEANMSPLEAISLRGTHQIQATDSLAGIALRYYGKPLAFQKILRANPKLDPQQPVLIVGDTLNIPKL